MKTFDFYGVCGNCYKLNDKVWEAIEDASDGYRSYLGSIEHQKEDGLTFFPDPIATVSVNKVDAGNFVGYEIVDVIDGHVWLEIGTNSYDSYYPCFIFRYTPKPPPLTWDEFISE